MKNAIVVRGLCKSYGDFALQNIDLTLPGGAIMGLIGENGAGKTTTLKCILNLIRRDAGEITLLGKDGVKEERAVKEDIGAVLDESLFHDTLTVENVDKIMAKLYRKWDKNLFADYVKKFDLPKNLYLKEFSRGMKMKLSIAAALAHHPKLLILDEATSGLDPVVRDEILDEFLEFIQDESKGILISSHITSDLEKAADYVTYLHKGRVVLQGAKDELLEEYGKLVCAKADLGRVDRSLLAGTREGQFGCEALVRDRRAFRYAYPDLPVDPVTLEEIMVFMVRGK